MAGFLGAGNTSADENPIALRNSSLKVPWASSVTRISPFRGEVWIGVDRPSRNGNPAQLGNRRVKTALRLFVRGKKIFRFVIANATVWYAMSSRKRIQKRFVLDNSSCAACISPEVCDVNAKNQNDFSMHVAASLDRNSSSCCCSKMRLSKITEVRLGASHGNAYSKFNEGLNLITTSERTF